MSQVTLLQIGSTNLYQPEKPGKDEKLVFLRWDTGNPPQQISIDETWADSGSPKVIGYYNFLNQMPDSPDAAELEKKLRAGLPTAAPKCTGFTWAAVSQSSTNPGTGIKVDFLAVVEVTPGNEDQPQIVKDVNVVLPKGMTTIGFGGDSPVLAYRDKDNSILGFTITYPPQPTSMVPNGPGINLPMWGNFVGCIQFQGLTGQQPFASDGVIKTRVNVQIDPLRPYNPKRTYTILTGDRYILSKTESGYVLRVFPVPGLDHGYQEKFSIWRMLKAPLSWILSFFRGKW